EEAEGRDPGRRAPRQRQARDGVGSAGTDRRVQVPRPPEDRWPRPDAIPERASRHAPARVDLGEAAPQWRGRHALPARARLTSRCSGLRHRVLDYFHGPQPATASAAELNMRMMYRQIVPFAGCLLLSCGSWRPPVSLSGSNKCEIKYPARTAVATTASVTCKAGFIAVCQCTDESKPIASCAKAGAPN